MGHAVHVTSETESHGLFMYCPIRHGLVEHVLGIEVPAGQKDPLGHAVFIPFEQ